MKCERCPRLDGVARVPIDGEEHELCPRCTKQVQRKRAKARVKARGGLRV